MTELFLTNFSAGISTYIIVCAMVFLAGFVDAIAGGGGLISLPGYLIAGLPPHAAIATNKLSSAAGTLAATLKYARAGFINWRLAGACSVAVGIGAALGARLLLFVPPRYLLYLLLVILPATACYLLRSRRFGEEGNSKGMLTRRELLLALGVSLVVGVYDGFYGPGTGTFLIFLLTAVVHLSIREANGVSKVINLVSNVAGLTVFLIEGQVLIVLGLVAAVFSVAGNYLGASFFNRRGLAVVKPIMITVIVLFLARIIYTLWW